MKFFTFLFGIFLISLASASSVTLTSFGETSSCFGTCSGSPYWTINNSTTIDNWNSAGGFDSAGYTINSFQEGYITLKGGSYNDTTSVVHNLTYFSNSSGIFVFNNSNAWTITQFQVFGTGSAGIFDVYIYNFTSSSYKFIDQCADFCTTWTTYNSYDNWHSFSSDYKNSSGHSLVKIDVSYSGITNLSLSVLHGTPVSRYAQNITLLFSSNPEYNYTVWNSTNFTENNYSTINLTSALKTLYPSGSGDISFNVTGNGYGLVTISNGSMIVDAFLSSGAIPPISEVKNLFLGGASLSVILKAYNPEMYPQVSHSWSLLWSKDEFSHFPSNLFQFVTDLIKFTFRQPATLVSLK